ncbi:MAG: tyrosine-type recombinase/integrase [Candidatus Pseudomonas phytovorans]|uniref:Tyrosine-type recombinase/integrase n=1 Tax=Candidatus Pseudomonas phytovorans TaxID=3121377 RepID=A0AAJ5WGZ8_9PSED|nr:tyrosine-type recombinase/integrase [Pseudomonas sp.]WEK29594.1 MAG: tyrosine-type recombinase/integrase [Pseudomonas sp.]
MKTSKKGHLFDESLAIEEDADLTEDAEDLSDDELLLQDMDDDEEESELEELEALQEEAECKLLVPSTSLVNKLEATDGNFPISDTSNYLDPNWHLKRGRQSGANNVKFDRILPGSNALKRALIYHVIPEISPFRFIRSYRTTHCYGQNYRLIEQYILEPNKLTAEPQYIKMISAPILIKSLEAASDASARPHAFELYKLIRLWIQLSEHRLIPAELRLEVKLEEIESRDRMKTYFQKAFRGTMEAWVSYSEEDLEVLVDYSMFWLEEALPKLIDLKNYLIESGTILHHRNLINKTNRDLDFENKTTIIIDDKIVMQPNIREHLKGGKQNFGYTWVAPYSAALDKVRCAIFILVALVTGARKSELAIMKFSDLTTDTKGDYWLRIIRSKTAPSPTHGEEDKLPIPKFVGDMIRKFEDARNIGNLAKAGYLFQSTSSTKSVVKDVLGIVILVINQLKAELPIERLHCHRFRKTIAEILINRDERNIDIIRALFGHKSYAMTLSYIARNPLMVRTVAIAIEQSYTREFHEIVAGIKFGGYSGDTAKRIYEQIFKRPEDFTGKQLKLSLMSYITHVLAAGEPLFVRRTAVGTYCLTGEHFTQMNLPPCLHGRKVESELIMPDPSNCQLDCRKIIVLETAKQALQDNSTFYTTVLEKAQGKLNMRAEHELHRRIASIQYHLKNLEDTGHSASQLIEVQHV